VEYQDFYFNPATGKRHAINEVILSSSGVWQAPPLPTLADRVLMLERKTSWREET
jgi:hypothetical protein